MVACDFTWLQLHHSPDGDDQICDKTTMKLFANHLNL